MKIIPYSELTEELARAGCFVSDMPNEAYHAYDGISKSGLDLVDRSPAHYFFRAETQPTRAMEIGTAIHTAILEPERFQSEYVLLKEVKDRRASEFKEAVKVHGSERVLVSTEAVNVAGMQETVLSQPSTKELLDAAVYFELSAFIECPKTGVLLRCRYDALTANHIAIDLKKTQDSSREGFAKSVINYRYHVQDAMYSHVYELITGTSPRFVFLAVEEKTPFWPMVHELDSEAKQIGMFELERNLKEYADAEKDNEWKGYETTNEHLALPSWAISQFENKLEGEIE
jgi:hypothetical protein